MDSDNESIKSDTAYLPWTTISERNDSSAQQTQISNIEDHTITPKDAEEVTIMTEKGEAASSKVEALHHKSSVYINNSSRHPITSNPDFRPNILFGSLKLEQDGENSRSPSAPQSQHLRRESSQDKTSSLFPQLPSNQKPPPFTLNTHHPGRPTSTAPQSYPSSLPSNGRGRPFQPSTAFQPGSYKPPRSPAMIPQGSPKGSPAIASGGPYMMPQSIPSASHTPMMQHPQSMYPSDPMYSYFPNYQYPNMYSPMPTSSTPYTPSQYVFTPYLPSPHQMSRNSSGDEPTKSEQATPQPSKLESKSHKNKSIVIKAADGSTIDLKKKKEVKNEVDEREVEKKGPPDGNELEIWIRELEERERIEEERERALQKKKADEKAKELEARKNFYMTEEELRRAEREAEEREDARLKSMTDKEKEEAWMAFDLHRYPAVSLVPNKQRQYAPGSLATITPRTSRKKPSALKLDALQRFEPEMPTPGQISLRSARFIWFGYMTSARCARLYPKGILAPTTGSKPNLKSEGHRYERDFLLQFQEVCREKPTVGWDKRIHDMFS
jgi:translation initiation factor 4G